MKILAIVVALVVGGLLGTLMVRDPGYVLVAYDNLTFESSVWFTLAVLVTVVAAVVLLIYLSWRLARGRSGMSVWFQQRRVHGARQQTVQGLLYMAEGRWSDAKKVLVGAVDRSETPLINYLNAARAAHELGDLDERDRLLRLAHETTPGSRFAIGLTQAQLQKSCGQWEQCLATLIQLRTESPRHPLILSMLADCYHELEDWEALLELVPDLRKHKVRSADELEEIRVRIWRGRLENIRGSADAATHAVNTWKSLPKDLKLAPDVVSEYVELLIAGGAYDKAEAELRSVIGREWRDDWVRLYGRTQTPDPARQLVTAQAWLKQRPNNPVLLLTLGRLSLMNEQWANAREYFETSLRLSRSGEIYGELGRLCLALGETQRGGEYLAQSIESVGTLLPKLPLPG